MEQGRALGLSDEDIVATATAFTAESITHNYKEFDFPRVSIDEILLAGCGANNATLIGMLRDRLYPIAITTIEERLGIPVEAREGLTMIAIGNDTVQGNAGNVPSATGAQSRVIAGDITPGQLG